MKSAKIFLLVLLAGVVDGCSQPYSNECKSLVADWEELLKRMEKSKRFSDKFIERHKIQSLLIQFFALDDWYSASGRNKKCAEFHATIKTQLGFVKIISHIEQEKLETLFNPPAPYKKKSKNDGQEKESEPL